jgi:hypothetical protein
MKPTAVYLIRSDQIDGLFKVGLSDSVVRRVVQVKDSYHVGGSIEAQAWFPTRQAAIKAEKIWHNFLSELHETSVSGREWFRLDTELVNVFKRWATLSPNVLPLKARIKSGRMTLYQAEQLSNQLLMSIPYGRTTLSKTTRLRG